MAQKKRSVAEQIKRLRTYNIVAGLLHLFQAVAFGYALSLLDNQVLFGTTVDYMTGPPGSPLPTERVVLFEVNLGIGVVAFLALSAFFHFLISSPQFSDFSALVGIFAVNASMIFFGALQEKYETPGNGQGLPFIMGSITGIIPWILIGVYTLQPGSTSAAEVPGFVIGIIISLFVFFNTFAINQALQYKKWGSWANYLKGERTYITLSLVAKSILAWQVFSGAIIPALTA
jgi:hypothetical protein